MGYIGWSQHEWLGEKTGLTVLGVILIVPTAVNNSVLMCQYKINSVNCDAWGEDEHVEKKESTVSNVTLSDHLQVTQSGQWQCKCQIQSKLCQLWRIEPHSSVSGVTPGQQCGRDNANQIVSSVMQDAERFRNFHQRSINKKSIVLTGTLRGAAWIGAEPIRRNKESIALSVTPIQVQIK